MSEWKWTITRWTLPVGYDIDITHGWSSYGPDGGSFICFGTKKRAIRKAKRIITREIKRREVQGRNTFEGVVTE